LIFSLRADRAARRAERRQNERDDFGRMVEDYADNIRDVLTSEDTRAATATEFPEAEVVREDRRLADAAIARGLLIRGSLANHVALPEKSNARALNYHGGRIFD
jgi:hypothetical protein